LHITRLGPAGYPGLDTSRVEAGKLELHLEGRDLRDFGREVVELEHSPDGGRVEIVIFREAERAIISVREAAPAKERSSGWSCRSVLRGRRTIVESVASTPSFAIWQEMCFARTAHAHQRSARAQKRSPAMAYHGELPVHQRILQGSRNRAVGGGSLGVTGNVRPSVSRGPRG
jgi:hypothetical protein